MINLDDTVFGSWLRKFDDWRQSRAEVALRRLGCVPYEETESAIPATGDVCVNYRLGMSQTRSKGILRDGKWLYLEIYNVRDRFISDIRFTSVATGTKFSCYYRKGDAYGFTVQRPDGTMETDHEKNHSGNRARLFEEFDRERDSFNKMREALPIIIIEELESPLVVVNKKGEAVQRKLSERQRAMGWCRVLTYAAAGCRL